jgi:hypothetical protein
MGVPTSEVGYTPAVSRREDHEIHKGHVVAMEKKKQFYALPTLYLCVLYLSENKQRFVPLTAYTDWFCNRDEKCLQRGSDWVFK